MLKLTIEGLDDQREYLAKLQSIDLLTLKKAIVKLLQKDIEQRFLTSPTTSTGGYPHPGEYYWKELSESYLAKFPNRRNGQQLIDTGALRDSLIYENAANSYLVYTDTGLDFGTSLEYAPEQDELRPFLYLHEILVNQMEMLCLDYISSSEIPESYGIAVAV
jgi:hypothetical protein